jgi:hypothetical protein
MLVTMVAQAVAGRLMQVFILRAEAFAKPLEAHVSTFCRFIDSFGFEWQAYEVVVSKPSPLEDRRVLYFFSRGSTRALEDFPRHWENLGWADLEDLCAQARAVYRDGPVDVHPGFNTRARPVAPALASRDGLGVPR